jgi:hypothetical protein
MARHWAAATGEYGYEYGRERVPRKFIAAPMSTSSPSEAQIQICPHQFAHKGGSDTSGERHQQRYVCDVSRPTGKLQQRPYALNLALTAQPEGDDGSRAVSEQETKDPQNMYEDDPAIDQCTSVMAVNGPEVAGPSIEPDSLLASACCGIGS